LEAWWPSKIRADLQQRLAYEQRLVQLVDRIHAAKGVDSIFHRVQGEILGSSTPTG